MALFSGKFGKVFGNVDAGKTADGVDAVPSESGTSLPSSVGPSDTLPTEVDAPWMEPLAPSVFDTATLKALYMTRPATYTASSPVDDLKALIKRAIDERALPLTMFTLVLKLYGVFSGDREFYRSTLQDYAHRWGTMDEFFAMEEYGAFYVKFFRGCTVDELHAAMEHIKEMRAAVAAPPAEFLMMLDSNQQPGTDTGEGMPL